MLWFSRGSFSESELPLSCNAKVTNARACARAINWLRDQPFEQGMAIYIYNNSHIIYTYINIYIYIYDLTWTHLMSLEST